jgi:hypothetical protein
VQQLLGEDFWAMASVRPIHRWPSIPKAELMEALLGKCPKVIRSDEATGETEVFGKTRYYVKARIPITC